MATTFVEYTGDGNATKSFSFPSYQESDVKVRVDGVLKTTSTHYNITSYTTTGGGNVVFTSGNIPSSPAKIRIYRDTSVDVAKATYTAGSSVKAADLNNNNTQLLYRAQEEQVPNLIQSYDIADQAIETSDIKDGAVTTVKIAADNITSALIADDQINSEHYVDGSIDTQHIGADQITNALIADNQIDSEHYVDGSIDRVHLAADIVDGTKIADDSINSEHYVDASIDEQHIANSQVTSNKIADNAVGTTEIANGAVTRAKLEADIIDGTRLADNAVDSEHYTDGSIDEAHLSASAVTENKIADGAVAFTKLASGSVISSKIAGDAVDGTKIADDSIDSEHIAAGALDNEHYAAGSITADKLNGATVITASEQGSATTNDTSFLTSAAADARFFNISSGDTIKDGQTFPDNDTTIATTAAINDRIIDIVNDIGGFDIIQSEQHFPNTNPQGVAGQAAVLSIKAASTNLVPSGTTVTITNGNLANNANITITGVTSTIPQDFGFLVESTSTLHTYSFHRLVPKATEVTTVAGKAVEIGRLGTADAVADMAILGTADVVADLNTLGTADVVADMNALAVTDVINDMNTLAVTDVISDMDVVAANVTNVNNVGNNITNVNSVSNSAGANQTFTVTVQNVSGNKYFIDGVQTPVLKLARGKTYTFDMSDSSNSSHPLAFRDSSDNSYTTGVTTSGTAGSSGATVVIVVAANAPSSLKYYCTSHGNAMGNTITVIDDNVGIVAGSISNVNTVGGDITNVNTTASSISNVNTVATNINDINDFTDKYRVGANNPTTGLDTGDLFFNTTSNSLKVYTGSAWVDGVTATGNFAVVTGNTFTGSNNHNDNVKSIYGTGSDMEIFHDGTHSHIIEKGSGNLAIHTNTTLQLAKNDHAGSYELMGNFLADGAAELYYDGSKKLNTTSTGVTVNGALAVTSGGSFGSGVTFTGANYNVAWVRSADTFRWSDNAILGFGASDDIKIKHDAINNVNLWINRASKTLKIQHDTEDSIVANANGSIDLFHDGNKKFETTSAGVSVTGNIATTGDITLTNTQPKIVFNDSNNNPDYQIENVQGVFKIRDNTNSADRLAVNTDGHIDIGGNVDFGAGIDVTGAITATGASTFSGNSIQIEGTQPHLKLIDTDNNDDFSIYNNHGQFLIYDETDGVSRFTIASDGATGIAGSLNVGGNIAVTGTVDGVDIAALNTTVSNITTDVVSDTSPQLGGNLDTNSFEIDFDDGHAARFGDGNDMQLYHSGSHGYLVNNTGFTYVQTDNFRIYSANGAEDIFHANKDGTCELYYDNSKKLETTSTGIQMEGNINVRDNHKVQLGNNQDLQIFHDGTHSHLLEKGSGNLAIHTDNILQLAKNDNAGSYEVMVQCIADGTTELYYDGSKKFETTSGGNTFHGYLFGTDNAKIYLGASNDLQIYHDGNDSYIDDAGTGSLLLRTTNNSTVAIKNSSANMARFLAGDAVELYHNNSKKFETTSTGVTITGNILAAGSNADIKIEAVGAGGHVKFRTTGSDRWYVEGSYGHFLPQANNTYDIGNSSYRVRNIYTNDLNLSNQGSSNDVDGTWGDWTIQEGESDLFLKNNRSGKKYKFNLTEVS